MKKNTASRLSMYEGVPQKEQTVICVPGFTGSTAPHFGQVDGETEYMVDSIATIAGKQFRVVRIKLRKGNMLMRKGKTAKAYEIKRIYGERS